MNQHSPKAWVRFAIFAFCGSPRPVRRVHRAVFLPLVGLPASGGAALLVRRSLGERGLRVRSAFLHPPPTTYYWLLATRLLISRPSLLPHVKEQPPPLYHP